MIASIGSVVDQKSGYTIVPVRLSKSIFARVTIRFMATTLTLEYRELKALALEGKWKRDANPAFVV